MTHEAPILTQFLTLGAGVGRGKDARVDREPGMPLWDDSLSAGPEQAVHFLRIVSHRVRADDGALLRHPKQGDCIWQAPCRDPGAFVAEERSCGIRSAWGHAQAQLRPPLAV